MVVIKVMLAGWVTSNGGERESSTELILERERAPTNREREKELVAEGNEGRWCDFCVIFSCFLLVFLC